MASEEENPFWDDETPSADPQIQLDYEALLGRFFVQFNRIENAVSDLLWRGLEKLGKTELFTEANKGQLYGRLFNLQLIMLAMPTHTHLIPYDRVRVLANRRNELAHGHFEQNPFDGSYKIIGRKLDDGKDWPREKLEALIKETEEIVEEVRRAYYDFWYDEFDDLPDEDADVGDH